MDRDRITSALATSKADYTEIRIETRRTTRIVFHGRRLETVQQRRQRGRHRARIGQRRRLGHRDL